MKPPVDADTPAPARGEADSGSGMKIALGVVVVLLFVEFALPGFVAAGLYRINPELILAHYVMVPEPLKPAGIRAEEFLFAPSTWLMKHSRAALWFYRWEYQVAGGKVVTLTRTSRP